MIPAMLDSICQSSRYQETVSFKLFRIDDTLFQYDTVCPHCQSAIFRIPWLPLRNRKYGRLPSFDVSLVRSCPSLPFPNGKRRYSDASNHRRRIYPYWGSAPRPALRPPLSLTGVPFP
ncbi:hypothetical protein LX32DRAFT_61331 [Colletotrichum zoysiae]|uniref:Uncharacterized protein n=1 Tax=Colletotrichum zoysiae TaxID=1216348 RepID=A0AAD9HAP9_9PEZI|nr:hypothetical protein LX32DRAFT_61331 [Colletotrichum zoysiae]